MSKALVSISEIGEWTKANRDANHDEIVTKFEKWIESRLAYSLDDRTLRLNETKIKGKPDIQCKDANEKTILVIEVKTDSDHIERSDNRKRIEKDQLKRYLTDNTIDPAYLILTDGVLLFFYENKNRALLPNKDLSIGLSTVSPLIEQKLIALCSRPEINYTTKASLDAYLSFLVEHPQHLDSKEGINFFVRKFALEPDGSFGGLVGGCIALMDHLWNKSKFFQGAYEFWSRTFFHETETLPKTWKAFLKSIGFDLKTEEERRVAVQKFEFALETAYNIFSRLVIAKAIDDLRFHEVINEDSPLDIFKRNLKFLRGTTNPIYFSTALVRLTERMREGFVSSIFEMDIFDWWVDAFRNEELGVDLENLDFSEIQSISDARLTFSKAIMQLFGQLYAFDFSELGEDLFGLLYQAYFDKDTRKALGEFYTPKEIVNFILDSCGYVPDYKGHLVNRRLIDPACGSGTFLIEAIKRFLQDARRAKIAPKETLDRLCNRAHIIGLDVHPFAAQLAKLSFVLHILPIYRSAVKEDRNFVLKRVPIYRTDSLFDETTATEKGRVGQTSLGFKSVARELEFGIPLPIKGEEGKFVNLILELPDRKTVRKELHLDEEEYFDVLHGLFSAMRKVAEDKEVDEQLHERIETLSESQNILMKLPELMADKKKQTFDAVRETVRKHFGRTVFTENKDLLTIHHNNCSVFNEYEYQDIVYHSIVKYIAQLDMPLISERIKHQLQSSLREQGLKDIDFDLVVDFFHPYCSRILLDSKFLKYRFGDGRLISSIEDRVVSILLKHYFHYDFVVANPPYVRIQRIAVIDPRLREHYNEVFSEVAMGNYDIYILFIELGINLLNDTGSMGFICPNRFTTVNYGEGIREFIPKNATIDLFLDFRDTGVFEDVLNYPAIIILEKKKTQSLIVCCRMKEKPENTSDEEILKEITEKLNQILSPTDHIQTKIFDVFGFDPRDLSKDGWYFMPYDERRVFDQIKRADTVLSEYTESTRSGSALFEGSSTGNKDIYVIKKISQRDGKVQFLSKTDQNIWEVEEDLFKPYVEDSRKWFSPYCGDLLILPYKLNENGFYEIIESTELKEQYPLAWKYFIANENALRARKGFREKSEWYAFSAPRSLEDYEQGKFLFQGFTRNSAVSIDADRKLFFGPDIYGLRLRELSEDDTKVLLAILNSKVTDFFVKHVGVIHGSGYYKFEDRFVKELPIRMPDSRLKQKITKMVEQIFQCSSKVFPDDFLGKVESYKIGSRIGEYDISIKNDEILIGCQNEHLRISGLQRDLQESVIVKIDRNSYIKCPSKDHWRFIEQYILSRAERRAEKVRVDTTFIKNIFIPTHEQNIQQAISLFQDNQKHINQLEQKIDLAIFELYEIESVKCGRLNGIDIIERFLY